MNKILSAILIYTLTITSVMAGLPPTTLSGQSQATKPTTFNFKTPYNQSTQTSGVNSLIETGSENMLVNPGFEGVGTAGWTCAVGTCTKTTTSGEFSSGTAALKVALSAQSMDVSQTIATPAGIQKQGYLRFIYRIPASGIVTPTVTITVDSVLQTTVPTDKLIMDGLFHSLEVPLVFGSTDVEISFLSGSSTGDVFFDGVVVAQGLGTQNLQGDTVYSAQMNASGTVSGENKDWINGSCAYVSSEWTCTFNTGLVTTGMNCTVNVTDDTTGSSVRAVVSTSSNLKFKPVQDAVGYVQKPVSIICQKSGADYAAASSSVYSQANSNTGWTSYTPTITGFGTPTAVAAEWKKIDDSILIRGTFTSGTSTAVEGRFSLPNSLTTSDTTKLPSIRPAGIIANAFNGEGSYFILMEPSTSYVTFGRQSSVSSGITKLTGSGFLGSGNQIYFNSLLIPISSFTNANTIVGSFESVPTVPNYGVVNIQMASVTTTSGTVSSDPNDLISGNCTAVNPTVCTFTTAFKSTPFCWAQLAANSSTLFTVTGVSTSSATIRSVLSTDGTDQASVAFSLFCIGER